MGGRTEDVEDVYALPWSRSCHTHHAARAKECICRLMHCGAFKLQSSPTEAVRTYSKGPTSMQEGTRVTKCGMCSHDPARPVAFSPKLNSHFVGQPDTGLL